MRLGAGSTHKGVRLARTRALALTHVSHCLQTLLRQSPTFLNRKKSTRTALSSSSGGRKIWKKMVLGCMPSQMATAFEKWPRL